MESPEDGRRRAFIEQVRPVVDCGRSALKRVLGEPIDIEADIRRPTERWRRRLAASRTLPRRARCTSGKASVFVTSSPDKCPVCVFRVEARHSASERDFDYFV